MRKLSGIIIASLLVGLLVLCAGSQARAEGAVTPIQLMSAGWFCFTPVPGEVVACFAPSLIPKLVNGSLVAFPFLGFAAEHPWDENAQFTRTGIMLRYDKYHGQPCGPEGLGKWILLEDRFGGYDYYLCHHGESD